MNLENDTEVIRTLIRLYYEENEKQLKGPPKLMWELNLSNDGVWIWDPELQRAVDIFFNREGIKCDECNLDNCKHIIFALAQEEIKKVVRKRKSEGWKLPEV